MPILPPSPPSPRGEISRDEAVYILTHSSFLSSVVTLVVTVREAMLGMRTSNTPIYAGLAVLFFSLVVGGLMIWLDGVDKPK